MENRAPFSQAELVRARERISGIVRETAVMTSRSINERAGAEIHFKCENFQRAGSFKIRGASHFMSLMSGDELAQGVVTHSSGNHAAAVALAAKLFKTHATVVMPSNAPEIKVASTLASGAEVIRCEPTVAAREIGAAEVVARTGATLVHPYDDDRIILGQSTATQEFLDQVPDLEALIVPVSGGGLLSGTLLAAHAKNPALRVYAAEPITADDAWQSVQQGRLVQKVAGETMADGLRANLCERTWGIINGRVEGVITVTEEEILAAMRLIWERLKIIAEPSAATALAPLLFRRDAIKGQRIGVLISGGNVDVPL